MYSWPLGVRPAVPDQNRGVPKDLIEHQTRFAGRSFQQIYHVDFFNQHGDRVAEADSWVFRTDRDEARERGTKYTEARHLVEISQKAHTHRNELSATGAAVVELPSRHA
jgi:hypothetical protein